MTRAIGFHEVLQYKPHQLALKLGAVNRCLRSISMERLCQHNHVLLIDLAKKFSRLRFIENRDTHIAIYDSMIQKVHVALTYLNFFKRVPMELKNHPAYFDTDYEALWERVTDRYTLDVFLQKCKDFWWELLRQIPDVDGHKYYSLRKSTSEGAGNVFICRVRHTTADWDDYMFVFNVNTQNWHFANESECIDGGYDLYLPDHLMYIRPVGFPSLDALIADIFRDHRYVPMQKLDLQTLIDLFRR